MTKLSRIILTALVAVGLVAGGYVTAQASIPHSATGVITGCYKSSGDLRVIDAQAGATCAGNETQLTWNQTGPSGPTCTPGAWQTLTLESGWGNFGGGWQSASVRQECGGAIRVSGLVLGPANSTIAFLPSGFCPEFNHQLTNNGSVSVSVNESNCSISTGGGTGTVGAVLSGSYPL